MTLPSSLTTVTPISKFLAMVLFVTLPFVGFYLGMQYGKISSTLTIYLSNKNALTVQSTQASSKLYTSSIYHITLQYPADFALKNNHLTHEGTNISYDELTGPDFSLQISSGKDTFATSKQYIPETIMFGKTQAILYKGMPQYFRSYDNGPIGLDVFIPSNQVHIFIRNTRGGALTPEQMKLTDKILSTIELTNK